MGTFGGGVMKNVRIDKLLEFDDITFSLVSGDMVHNAFDPRWKNDKAEGEFIGGHHYVFEFIPKNEVWISNLDNEPNSTMVHEYTEMLLMRDERLNYEGAHTIALKVESLLRNIDISADGKIVKFLINAK